MPRWEETSSIKDINQVFLVYNMILKYFSPHPTVNLILVSYHSRKVISRRPRTNSPQSPLHERPPPLPPTRIHAVSSSVQDTGSIPFLSHTGASSARTGLFVSVRRYVRRFPECCIRCSRRGWIKMTTTGSCLRSGGVWQVDSWRCGWRRMFPVLNPAVERCLTSSAHSELNGSNAEQMWTILMHFYFDIINIL